MIYKVVALLAMFTVAGYTATPIQQPMLQDVKRVIQINGPIKNLKRQTDKMLALSASSDKPVDIIISSPGGSVIAGMFFIDAMDRAKSRGVKIRCIVDKMAASMAMHIFGNCDERYALANSLLLWHPAYVTISFGMVTEERAKELKEQLHMLTYELELRLKKALNISDKMYEKHWRAEHFIPAKYLKEFISPEFLEIIEDF